MLPHIYPNESESTELRKICGGWVQWHTSLIQALWRLRQADLCEFKAWACYTEKHCLELPTHVPKIQGKFWLNIKKNSILEPISQGSHYDMCMNNILLFHISYQLLILIFSYR